MSRRRKPLRWLRPARRWRRRPPSDVGNRTCSCSPLSRCDLLATVGRDPAPDYAIRVPFESLTSPQPGRLAQRRTEQTVVAPAYGDVMDMDWNAELLAQLEW